MYVYVSVAEQRTVAEQRYTYGCDVIVLEGLKERQGDAR